MASMLLAPAAGYFFPNKDGVDETLAPSLLHTILLRPDTRSARNYQMPRVASSSIILLEGRLTLLDGHDQRAGYAILFRSTIFAVAHSIRIRL